MKELKKGFTTGTCAAVASKAACKMIFEKKTAIKESILTPKNILAEMVLYNCVFDEKSGECAVKKYSGDDPDITNGILIYSKVTLKKDTGVNVYGGKGVGTVTKSGLQVEIGKAAINKVPEKMIVSAVSDILEKYGYDGGADIVISIPMGEEIAKKTFNPRLGIVGGLSILGTSGIVEPMSEKAIIDTIKTELSVKRNNEGEYVIIAPGNYGMDFIKNTLNVSVDKAVKCSNFVGEALDFAAELDFKGVLLIGHIGKFVKLAGGIMNTHSKNADARIEILAANTVYVCDDINVARNVGQCSSADEALTVLKKAGIRDKVMKRILDKALYYTNNRVKEVEIAVIMFSGEEILGKTDNADKILKEISKNL